MFEREGEIVVRAELPGVRPEDVEVSILEDSLRIRGERKQKEEVKEENFYRMEQRYGLFERVMQLPTKVKADDIKAKFAEGVLEITMPKAEEEKPKQIKINVEEEK
jgi:HSP20 family protein